MMKRIFQAVIVLVFLVGMLVVGWGQSKSQPVETETEIDLNDETIIDVNTTIMNAIDKSIDANTVRIEQMFVVDTFIDEMNDDYIIVLEDNYGYTWECINMDLHLYDDVLVLVSDNHTQEDVTDDVFLHYWLSIE